MAAISPRANAALERMAEATAELEIYSSAAMYFATSELVDRQNGKFDYNTLQVALSRTIAFRQGMAKASAMED
eukprot:3777038-Heterocapsa_arctica.AAC.1